MTTITDGDAKIIKIKTKCKNTLCTFIETLYIKEGGKPLHGWTCPNCKTVNVVIGG